MRKGGPNNFNYYNLSVEIYVWIGLDLDDRGPIMYHAFSIHDVQFHDIYVF